jgi:hypothetical protein
VVELDKEFPDKVSVTSGGTYRKSFKIVSIAKD